MPRIEIDVKAIAENDPYGLLNAKLAGVALEEIARMDLTADTKLHDLTFLSRLEADQIKDLIDNRKLVGLIFVPPI